MAVQGLDGLSNRSKPPRFWPYLLAILVVLSVAGGGLYFLRSVTTKENAPDPEELVRRGHLDEAVSLYRLKLNQFPLNSSVHARIGYLLQRLGRNEEAIAELREAIRLDKEELESEHVADLIGGGSMPGVHYDLARLLEAKGDLQGALTEYKAAEDEAPDSFAAYSDAERVAKLLAQAEDSSNKGWRITQPSQQRK